MSSTPQQSDDAVPAPGMLPFASYAQIVRMLLPLTGKVCFYDATGHALWISDGIEGPELRMHVEILLERAAADETEEMPVHYSASDEGEPTYVFALRHVDRKLAGALSVVFRDLPPNATYRRVETVERLIAPVLDILQHSLRIQAAAAASKLPLAALEDTLEELQMDESSDATTPLPALLRRNLALATRRLECAFGSFVVVDRPFTLSHRASPDESDLAINAAIDSVRGPMLKLMQVRNEPLIVNAAAVGSSQMVPFKLLVLPLRPTSSRLAAMLMLFRGKRDRDFTSADVSAATQVLARIPSSALKQLVRETPATQTAPIPTPTVASKPETRPTVDPPPPAPVTPPDTTVSAAAPEKINLMRMAQAQFGVPLQITRDAAPTMDQRIRSALRDNSFDLFAQKISPLRDERRPARFEVLLRMQDADRLRAPSAFFEAAEAGALMPELDRWVIRRLLSTLRTNAALVRSGSWEFCINIAAQSLIADRFSDFIVAEVCKSSIPAGLLVFEVSECDALEHQYALEFLGARLRDVGCRIALDNCRAGLTTFGPLHKWPVSCVKIDGSLIRNVASSARSESIVRAVAQLAGSMGIETVAERVESENVCDKLVDIGIDYAQGFHFGQPQPLETLFR